MQDLSLKGINRIANAEIGQLRAENAKLREALEKISEQYSRPQSGMTDFGESEHYKWNLIRCRDIAKKALK